MRKMRELDLIKTKEEKEKNYINKSQTQNSIKTNDTSGLQININGNALSQGNINNYNLNYHFNQNLNIDCHEINLSLLGKDAKETKNKEKKEVKPEKESHNDFIVVDKSEQECNEMANNELKKGKCTEINKYKAELNLKKKLKKFHLFN